MILSGFLFSCQEEEITPDVKKPVSPEIQDDALKATGDTANSLVGNSKP